jgi:hypothetical protein
MLLPWFIFLYVGVYDWGFYAHSLISTEDAARVAALYAANAAGSGTGAGGGSLTTACSVVLNELSVSSNLTGVTTCTGPVSDSNPVVVALSCNPGGVLDSVQSVQAAVTYRTMQLIPIPGLLTGKTTLYRTAQLPLATTYTSCNPGS